MVKTLKSGITIGACNWCGKKEAGDIEHWTPNGIFWGCSCQECYDDVMRQKESYFYHGGSPPLPLYDDEGNFSEKTIEDFLSQIY